MRKKSGKKKLRKRKKWTCYCCDRDDETHVVLIHRDPETPVGGVLMERKGRKNEKKNAK